MKQRLLMGAPVLLKIAAPKKEAPSAMYLKLVESAIDEACKFAERDGRSFDDMDSDSQEFMVDTYKLFNWFFHWTKKAPVKWARLYQMFEFYGE